MNLYEVIWNRKQGECQLAYVAKDLKRAVRLIDKAAQLGHAGAQVSTLLSRYQAAIKPLSSRY